MTEQMKFMIAGIFFLFLVLTMWLFMTGKKEPVQPASVSSTSPVAITTGEKGAGQGRTESVGAQSRSNGDLANRSSEKTNVSQAQVDLVRKREAARQRRDDMLAVRAKTIAEHRPVTTVDSQ